MAAGGRPPPPGPGSGARPRRQGVAGVRSRRRPRPNEPERLSDSQRAGPALMATETKPGACASRTDPGRLRSERTRGIGRDQLLSDSIASISRPSLALRPVCAWLSAAGRPAWTRLDVRPVGQGGGRRAARSRPRPNEPEGSAKINCLSDCDRVDFSAIATSPAGCAWLPAAGAALPGTGSGVRPVGQGGGRVRSVGACGRTNPRDRPRSMACDSIGRFPAIAPLRPVSAWLSAGRPPCPEQALVPGASGKAVVGVRSPAPVTERTREQCLASTPWASLAQRPDAPGARRAAGFQLVGPDLLRPTPGQPSGAGLPGSHGPDEALMKDLWLTTR